jgi:septal ring factor EnvC (AmiA/AmiB activator)
MKNLFTFILILFVGCLCIPGTYGQSKEELKEKIEKNEKEIELTNQIIKKTKRNRKSSINHLYVLKKRIELRNDLINQLNQQIANLDTQIIYNKEAIKVLNKDLKKLKDNYAKIIYYAYKHMNELDQMMFILSSESFNQAYKRYKYLKQYAEYRRNQAEEIAIKTQKLEYETQKLKKLKHDKQDILAYKTNEKVKLKNERIKVNNRISDLKSKEQQLRKELKEKRRIIAQLEKEIEKIIEEERKRTKLWKNLTERQKQISKSFQSNRGNLPWPINDGVVTRKFGEHEHPVLKGIKTYNNGVDINTSKESVVRSIFEGVTRKVVSIPGANLTVIIRHGNYLTVYSNLVDVKVKPGDIVGKGQIIGKVYEDQSKSESILHLEIYRESEKLNPEVWLE